LTYTPIYNPIRSDALQYTQYALNILNFGTHSSVFDPSIGDPVPDNWRTPGYPLFLALIMKLGGVDNFYVFTRLIQSLLGSISVLLTYLVARFFLPYWSSLLASLLVALSPHLISLENYILTESLFTFFLLLSIYLFFLAHKKKSNLIYILSGAAFGYAYLIIPTVFFVPWILVFVLLLAGEHRNKKQFLAFGLFGIFFLLFVVGYAVRNQVNVPPEKRQDRLIGNICAGTYPNFIYKSERYKYYMYREDPEYENCSSSLQGLRTVLWSRFKKSPGDYLKWYFLGKPKAYWGWDILQGFGDVYIYEPITTLFTKSILTKFLHDFMKWLHPFLVFFLFIGGIIHIFGGKNKIKRNLFSFLIFSVPIYYTLLFIVFFPLSRYSVPIRPELFLCGTWTLTYLLDFIRKSKNKSGEI
jgi:4-amino-4-deoxy-L-arabinose transferase-like glycosyltransferase